MEQEHYENEINLVDCLKVLFKYRMLIIAIVFFSMLLSGILNLSKHPSYEATATFFPLNIKEEDSVMTTTPKVGIEKLIISLLESRTMADKVIAQLDLGKLWKTGSMAAMRGRLKGMIGVSLNKNGIIELTARDDSANLAADIANAYVDNLDNLNREFQIGSQRQIVQVLDRAVVPEQRTARNTIKKTLSTGAMSFVFVVFLAFFLEFMRKLDLKKILKEE